MIESRELEKMHSLQLILADELKRICEKYNITYFMIYGTLLGAVRHGGFIPWDDDMDFGIPRTDFERFLSVCDKEINRQVFFLQTDRKSKYYPHVFAKLCLKGTIFKGLTYSKKNTQESIFIDIFPVDTLSDNKIKKWVQCELFRISDSLIKIKTEFVSRTRQKSIRHNIGRLIAPLFSIKFLKRLRLKSISRYSGSESKYVVTSGGAYGIKRETLKRKWIENIQEYAFEDRTYNGIGNYDEYLTCFYGDYMTLPSEDYRKCHAKSVDFGIYEKN